MTATRDAVLARLDVLIAGCRAATPGPWEAWQDPGANAVRIRMGLPPFDHDPEPSPYWSVQVEGSVFPEGAIAAFGSEDERGKEDARHCAAHSPDRMLALYEGLRAVAEVAYADWILGGLAAALGVAAERVPS